MKKVKFILMMACVPFCFINAQVSTEKKAGFQLSFIPPLSTQGIAAKEYTNAVSFNMLAGVSGNVTSFSLSGLGMYVVNDISGFHLSGLGTYAGNHGKGMMFSGLFNSTKDFNGLQFSGLVNLADEANGIFISGLSNMGHDLNGMQFSGLSNISKAANGFQFAGLANKASEMNGFQFAGLMNIAEDVNGFQFAGLMNIAKNVNGFQFAALVNIAESNDYPLGLVNIIKNGGEMSIGATYNEIGTTMLSFRSGGRILYGILGIGYNHKLSDRQFMVEAGFGGHIPICSRFRINNELKANNVTFTDKETTFHSSLAIMPAFKVFPKLEVFAGPSINYLNTDNVNNKKMFPGNNIWKKYEEDKLQQLYIAFSAGIHYVF